MNVPNKNTFMDTIGRFRRLRMWGDTCKVQLVTLIAKTKVKNIYFNNDEILCVRLKGLFKCKFIIIRVTNSKLLVDVHEHLHNKCI